MKLFEYQTKNCLKEYNIPVPEGMLITSLQVAEDTINTYRMPVFIKPQTSVIPIENYIENTPEKIIKTLKQLFKDTGLMTMRMLMIESVIDVSVKIYINLQMDRSMGKISLTVNTIINKKNIVSQQLINPFLGLRSYQARDIAGDIELERQYWNEFTQILRALYRCYVDSDAEKLSILPLGITASGEFFAMNPQMTINNKALYRQQNFAMMESADLVTNVTIQAQQTDISYVKLEGQISCIANGAGLGMAVLDAIYDYGDAKITPANFMDIGHTINPEKIDTALRIALSEEGTHTVLITIFGGITRCDEIAQGIIKTYEGIPPAAKIVIRFAGTQSAQGKMIIDQAQIPNVITETTLNNAIQTAIQFAQEQTT